jgi:hypothetical protein
MSKGSGYIGINVLVIWALSQATPWIHLLSNGKGKIIFVVSMDPCHLNNYQTTLQCCVVKV